MTSHRRRGWGLVLAVAATFCVDEDGDDDVGGGRGGREYSEGDGGTAED